MEGRLKEDLKEMNILLTEANSFRELAKKKRASINDLENSFQKLEDEIKSL